MGSAPSEQGLSRLIASIYDAALDEGGEGWGSALALVGAAVGAHNSTVLGIQRESRKFSGLFRVGVEPAAATAYETHFAHCDPVLEPAIARASAGAILVTDALITRSDLVRTEFYTDWLRPRGAHSGLCAVLLLEGTARALLYLARERADGPFGREDLRLVSLLAPHVRRACQVAVRLAAGAGGPPLGAAIERLLDPLLVVDALAQVTFANPAAEALLATRDGLWTNRSGGERRGRLRAATPTATAALRRLVAGAAGAAGAGDSHARTGREAVLGPHSSGGVLVLPRPSMRPALLLVVAPLPAPIGARGSAFAALVPAGGQGAALVSIVDPARTPSQAGLEPVVGRYLCAQYALTATEAAVALDIVAGDGLEAVAAGRQVTLATVRTQARHIYLKTGVRGQVGLSQLVSGVRAAVRPGGSRLP
jgi:DNA-binding CsgD family transcriptional regulator/PAS domain-containing protein